MFLAQAAADPISGGAGWVGAGLLGAVLSWLLLVHLPGKDKLLKEFVDNLLARHEVIEREQRLTFKEAMGTVVDHCKEEMDRVTGFFRKE